MQKRMMKNLTRLICVFLSLLVLTSCKTGEPELPNIVLIISDDQGWTDYSFMGHGHIRTPRIDQLASEGLTLTRGYTTAPLCRPALASIITGLYPHQHGVIGNDPVFDPVAEKRYGPGWLLERAEYNEPYIRKIGEVATLADLLGEAGYVSLQTGKWWEGHFSRGGFTRGMTHGDPSRGGRHGDDGLEIGRQGLDIIFDFIDQAQKEERPFFVWYAPFLPHAPHTSPDSLREKYLVAAPSQAVANYRAMCEWFDITVGRLMDTIQEKGLSEETLFIYVTDNGWIQDPDRPNRYAPRSKREPYEMGIRTPIIYRWTGTIEPEMDTTSLASCIDIAPTVLRVCGLEPTHEMQGINMLDEAVRKERDAIFAETYAHDFSTIDSSLYYRVIIAGAWKLILPDPANRPEGSAQLYNLVNDPHERNNLAEENPEIVSRLQKRLEEWWLD